MATNAMKKARAADQYAQAVVEALIADFPHLAEGYVRGLVVVKVAEHAFHPREPFEVIVDDVSVANWRLREDRDQPPGRVRLACHKLGWTDADRTREDRINAALREIA